MDDKVCNANFFSVTCLTKIMRMGRLAVVSRLTRRGGGAGEATLRIIEHLPCAADQAPWLVKAL